MQPTEYPSLTKAALVNRHPLLNLFYEAFVALIAKPDKERIRKENRYIKIWMQKP